MAKKNTLIRLKKKERELRQKIIIEAARDVFGKKTYDRVSMAEIANTAGIGKSSIYTYFKNQEELYTQIAYEDACSFIKELKDRISTKKNVLKTGIEYFMDYYILHESQWRMITHFALHGNKNMGSMDKLNDIGRKLMDVIETFFEGSGCKTDKRLLAHTLFSCLSGVLISFRNYPGRSENDRIVHMKKIGSVIESMVTAQINP